MRFVFTILAGLSGAAMADDNATRAALEALPKATSALVIQNGVTLFEAYTGEGGESVLNDTRSVTKTITALAAGIAIADGRIALDAPVLPLFADLEPAAHAAEAKTAMTLADLLIMSSPLACDDSDPETPGNEDRMHEHDAWGRFIVDLPVKADAARDASGRYPFVYCTVNAVLAGLAIGRAEGMSFDAFADARLFAPLGVGAHQWQYSPSGEPMPGGGLRLTTRDLGRIGQLIAQHGDWQGRQIVPAAWIDAMLTPYRDAGPPGFFYGYLTWGGPVRTPCGEKRAWFMAGNGGNAVMMVPELNAVAVLTRTAYNEKNVAFTTLDFLQDQLLAKLACS